MTTTPAHLTLHLDHIGDNNRAVVVTNRIGNIVQIVSWTVHGDKAQALHDINTLKTSEVEQLHDTAKWIRTMAAMVLDARRELGEEIGCVVLWDGREPGGPLPGRAI